MSKKFKHQLVFKFVGIVFLAITFLIPFKIQAQDANHELRINIYQSRVTDAAEASGSFFNTTILGFEYQYELLENLNGVIGVRFIQIITPLGNDIEIKEESSVIKGTNNFLLSPATACCPLN